MSCCAVPGAPSPAELRHRIEIQALTLVGNDSGGADETWNTVATVWASLKPKIIKEKNFAQRIEARTDHEIWIRYIGYPALTTVHRIKFGTRLFHIKALNIMPDEIKEWWKMATEEGTGT